MLRRCSWCGLNTGQVEPLDDRSVTHGICLPCSAGVIAEYQHNRTSRGQAVLVEEFEPASEPFAPCGMS
jgi:hypothetical protein